MCDTPPTPPTSKGQPKGEEYGGHTPTGCAPSAGTASAPLCSSVAILVRGLRGALCPGLYSNPGRGSRRTEPWDRGWGWGWGRGCPNSESHTLWPHAGEWEGDTPACQCLALWGPDGSRTPTSTSTRPNTAQPSATPRLRHAGLRHKDFWGSVSGPQSKGSSGVIAPWKGVCAAQVDCREWPEGLCGDVQCKRVHYGATISLLKLRGSQLVAANGLFDAQSLAARCHDPTPTHAQNRELCSFGALALLLHCRCECVWGRGGPRPLPSRSRRPFLPDTTGLD